MPPVANFSGTPSTVNVGGPVTFTDLSTNTPTSWSWSFGDGNTSTEQNPAHIFNTQGTYSITLTATNSYGSDTETKTNYITVNESGSAPVADFSANITTIAEGGTITFTDLSANSPTEWSWSFGDGNISDIQNPSHTYNTAGIYTVSLTATNTNDSDTETKTNYITVSNTAQSEWVLIAEREMPYYMGWSDVLVYNNYLYAIGGGSNGFLNIYDISTMNNPTEVYTQEYEGNKFAHMLYEDNKLYIIGGTGLFIFDITNPIIPTLLAHHETTGGYDIGGYHNVIAKSGNILFTSSGLWRFNCMDITDINAPVYKDGQSFDWSTVDDFFVLSSTTGIFDGGSSLRYVDFSDPTNLQFSSSSDDNYIDYTSESEAMTVNNDKTLGFVSVWNLSGNGIHTTDFTTNQVIGTFDYNDIGVEGVVGEMSINESLNLLVAGNVVSFHIFDITDPANLVFKQEITSGGSNPVEFYNNYIFACGSGNLHIYAQSSSMPPVANFSGTPSTVNVGGSVTFTDLSTNTPTSWSWNFGDGNSSSIQNPSHTYNTAGIYTVSLTATNTNGSDTETKTNYITVNTSGSEPMAAFTANHTTIIEVGTINFSDQSTNTPTSWSWNFGDGETSNSQNPLHSYTTLGSYTVSLTVSNSYGSDTVTKTDYITVISSGAVDGTFTDSRDGHTYNWVKIGNQYWMAENLAYKSNTGCWAYDDNENNVSIYGYLYDWETACNICPDGWHLPSDDIVNDKREWSTLVDYLGGELVAGGKMKEIGTEHWDSPNTDATNESGFTALPGGWGSNSGSYYTIGIYGYWWDANNGTEYETWSKGLYYSSGSIIFGYGYKTNAFSVRCLRNEGTTNLPSIPASEITDISVVYPNPNSGRFALELKEEINEIVTVQIANLCGQIIYKYTIPANFQKITFDLSNYAKGIYFIQVRSDKYFKTEKLIIE